MEQNRGSRNILYGYSQLILVHTCFKNIHCKKGQPSDICMANIYSKLNKDLNLKQKHSEKDAIGTENQLKN